jgi:hypothetical protein
MQSSLLPSFHSVVRVVVVALLLSPVAASAQQTQTVKFRISSTGHQVVQGTVNGKGPYEMVFDTGANSTGLNPAVFGQGGNIVLALGDVKTNLNVRGHEHSNIKNMKQLQPDMARIEALIGIDMFGRYRVTIDYQKREMTFRPNGFDPGDTFGKFVARAQGAKYEKSQPLRAVALGLSVTDPQAGGRGARVTAVFAGSTAEQAGFKVGDSIVGIEQWWVEDAQDLYAHAPLFNPNATLKFYVLRGGKMETLPVKFRAGL